MALSMDLTIPSSVENGSGWRSWNKTRSMATFCKWPLSERGPELWHVGAGNLELPSAFVAGIFSFYSLVLTLLHQLWNVKKPSIMLLSCNIVNDCSSFHKSIGHHGSKKISFRKRSSYDRYSMCHYQLQSPLALVSRLHWQELNCCNLG